MKKKIILLAIFLFTITGCTTQYDLIINESSFDESITITAPKSEFNRNEIQVYSEQKIPITQETTQTKFYSNSMTDDNLNYYLKLNYSHNIDTIKKSYFITKCYPNTSIIETPEQIEISTGSEFMCINIDDGWYNAAVQVNIITDLKVIENNADEIRDNIYTWNINENNYTNKPINIVMEKTSQEKLKNVVQNVQAHKASTELFIIYGIVGLLVIITVILIRIKIKKNNKI